MTKAEEIKELQEIIREAWGYVHVDFFDDLLDRVANEIYAQGYRKINQEMVEQIKSVTEYMMEHDHTKAEGKPPKDCVNCEHHHCFYDSDGVQDCSCALSVFAKTCTHGIPKSCPRLKE